ncbi:hypothetical protein [Bdellovibrio sp. KM01]|nr:hypothetical protein [Bdellovibrio sp. KM01]QLY24900.1 hypothetical protein HW988_15930 [Bdellovibrio sp. KM01]
MKSYDLIQKDLTEIRTLRLIAIELELWEDYLILTEMDSELTEQLKAYQ